MNDEGRITRSTAIGALLVAVEARGGIPPLADTIQAAPALFAMMNRAELLAEVEALDTDRRALQALYAAARELYLTAADMLLGQLGPGEALEAPSGRYAFRGRVSGGRAAVNLDALVEHRDELPPSLRAREVLVGPSVSELRRAGLTRDLERALIVEPPKVDGLRWRTLHDDQEESP